MGKFFSALSTIGEGVSRSTSQKIAWLCNSLISLSLYVLAFGVPLFFLPLANNVLEFAKQLVLFGFSSLALLAWLVRMLVERKVELRSTVVNALVILFAGAYTISTLTSQSIMVSFLGIGGQEKNALLTVLSFVALYFVLVNNVFSMKKVRSLLHVILASGLISAVFVLLQGMGKFVFPFQFAQSSGFTTVGTPVAFAGFMAFVLAIAGGLLLAPHGGHQCQGKWCAVKNGVLFLCALLPLLLVSVISFTPILIAVIVGALLLIGFAVLHVDVVQKGVKGILLPIAMLIISLLAIFVVFPVGLQYPAEVMPSHRATSQITSATLRDAPLFGSGPGTFINDYAKYHSSDVNQYQYWDIRFDRGSSRLMTLAATTGLFGLLSHLMLILFVFFGAVRAFISRDEETWHTMIGVFAAWTTIVVVRLLYSSSLTLEFLFWVSTALLVITIAPKTRSIDFSEAPRASVVASFLFIFSIVSVVGCSYVSVQRYLADKSFAAAYSVAANSGELGDVARYLEQSLKHQPRNDEYLRNYAKIQLDRAIQSGRSTPEVKREDKETDAQMEERRSKMIEARNQETVAFASSAVEVAIRAVDVNPSNVANWIMLGNVYQNIMSVTRGASDEGVAAYTKAIELEPANPALYTELGKIYIFQANQAGQTAAQSKDEAVKKDAQTLKDELLAKANVALSKAIELKADYALAHYQLAVTLDMQGKIKDSIERMEAVREYAPNDLGVAFQLALLYQKDGRKDAALRLLELVVKNSPAFAGGRRELASMYKERGELDKALEQLRELVVLDPSNEEAKAEIADIEAKKAAAAAPVEGVPKP